MQGAVSFRASESFLLGDAGAGFLLAEDGAAEGSLPHTAGFRRFPQGELSGLVALVKIVRQRRGAGTEAHAALLGGGDALHLVLLALLLAPLVGGGEDQLGNEDVQRVAVS